MKLTLEGWARRRGVHPIGEAALSDALPISSEDPRRYGKVYQRKIPRGPYGGGLRLSWTARRSGNDYEVELVLSRDDIAALFHAAFAEVPLGETIEQLRQPKRG
jgi:hypothetical protein